MGFAFDIADNDVTARRQDSPPKFVEIAYEFRLVTDEDERRVNLLHRNLSRFGTVCNTLWYVVAGCVIRWPFRQILVDVPAQRCQTWPLRSARTVPALTSTQNVTSPA